MTTTRYIPASLRESEPFWSELQRSMAADTVYATGDACFDTCALQSAIDSACATGRPMYLSGTFRLRFDTSAPWFYAYSDPTRPVYPALRITANNLTIIGRNARFLFERPTNAPDPGPEDPDDPFLLTSPNAVYVGIGTEQVDDKAVRENISISGVTFDFLDDQGALPSFVQTMWFCGCRNVSITNCKFTATPVEQAVTITADGANQAVVAWADNRMVNGKSCVWPVAGSLPPEINLGDEFYPQAHTSTQFNLSENDRGALLTITPGTYACTLKGIRFNMRGLHFDNCDRVTDSGNVYSYGRQGSIWNVCRDVTITNNKYHQLGEGIDNDTGLDGFLVSNCIFTQLWGEAQPLDFSPARNGTIDNIYCDRTRTPVQLYQKINGTTLGWQWLRKHKYFRAVTVTVASPGVLKLAGATLVEGNRFWMEIRPNNTGSTMPTGTAEFTTYLVRNPVGDTCNLSLATGGSGGALINITGAAVLATGSFLRAGIVGDPTTVLPSENVTVSNLTVVNTRDNTRDLFRIGTLRQARAGTDRLQYESGGPLPKNIRLRNIYMEGGSNFHIYEGDNIDIDGLTLVDQEPGTDAGDGAALVVAQSLNDTTATSQSAVKAKLRNVRVVNSQGMAISVRGATDLDMDRINVEGWNVQASDNTRQAIQVSRPTLKTGTYKIGKNIETTGGVAGATLAVRAIQMVSTGGDLGVKQVTFESGPMNLHGATVAGTGVYSDMGPSVVSRRSIRLGSISTAGGTQTIDLLNSHATYIRVMGASVSSRAAITGDATNYTSFLLRKSTAGTVGNISSSANIDAAARSAGAEIALTVDGTADLTVLAPGATLYVQYTKNGTGSTTDLVLELAYVEFAA